MKGMYRLVFRYRNTLAGAPLVFAFFSTRWEWENEWGVWLGAIFLCSFGIWLRAWSACHCNYAQGGKKELATSGPYAYVRNPLYLGNMAILAGATVASELVWLLPASLCWAFVIYAGTIKHEEARLRAKYGQAYMEYKARVPAWFLDFSKLLNVENPFIRALLRQCAGALILLPFVLKELKLLDLWPAY